jgi:hypothetical protein
LKVTDHETVILQMILIFSRACPIAPVAMTSMGKHIFGRSCGNKKNHFFGGAILSDKVWIFDESSDVNTC